MKDPFSWFEQQFAKQQQQQQSSQQQQQRQQGYQGYQQQRRQQQQQFGGSRATSGSPGDPMGYYNTLGVKPGCSTQEIQAAFRGLALQHHPDRYSSAADKETATKKFQVSTRAMGWTGPACRLCADKRAANKAGSVVISGVGPQPGRETVCMLHAGRQAGRMRGCKAPGHPEHWPSWGLAKQPPGRG